MRSIGQPLRDKHFDPSAGRAEFIPVEWRSSLRLDGGMIDSVTPHQMLGLRQMLNDSFMDIMYYTSPLYRDELVAGLRGALNTVYANFTGCYPRFEARGGRVSVVAHSLGCVILHDLVTGWRPGHEAGVVSTAAAQLRVSTGGGGGVHRGGGGVLWSPPTHMGIQQLCRSYTNEIMAETSLIQTVASICQT